LKVIDTIVHFTINNTLIVTGLHNLNELAFAFSCFVHPKSVQGVMERFDRTWLLYAEYLNLLITFHTRSTSKVTLIGSEAYNCSMPTLTLGYETPSLMKNKNSQFKTFRVTTLQKSFVITRSSVPCSHIQGTIYDVFIKLSFIFT
jgi:hypothetical protein